MPVCRTIVRDTETRSFYVELHATAGWRTIVAANDTVAERQCSEWHRVERDLERFAEEIARLLRQGWREA